MSLSITSIDFEAADQKGLEVSNAAAMRKWSAEIGSTWTTLRLAVHYSLADTGANLTGTPRLWLGAMKDPSEANSPLTGSTDHFVGIRTHATTWTRAVTSDVAFYTPSGTTGNNRINPTKLVGSTITTATGKSYRDIASLALHRGVITLDLVKGSPNYTFKIGTMRGDIGLGANFIHNVTHAQFLAAISPPIIDPTVLGYVSSSYWNVVDYTLAVDESANGTLNAFCFAWDRAAPVFRLANVALAIF